MQTVDELRKAIADRDKVLLSLFTMLAQYAEQFPLQEADEVLEQAKPFIQAQAGDSVE